jgi:P-type E1-E2 ATPase
MGTIEVLKALKTRYTVAILTGDTKENTQKLFDGLDLTIHDRCLPEDKFAIIKAAQINGGKVMMVGDGLNDAPALALADVGVVFSGTENSASIEAAAIAILNRDIASVPFILDVADASTRIARESILWGIGLSIIGMLFAAFGFIPPVTGAILQECIDVTVIMNALRAAR